TDHIYYQEGGTLRVIDGTPPVFYPFPTMSATICEEKAQLMREYQRTTELYAAAVNNLAKKMGVLLKAEYDRLNAATETARHASADARDRLQRHIAQHGC